MAGLIQALPYTCLAVLGKSTEIIEKKSLISLCLGTTKLFISVRLAREHFPSPGVKILYLKFGENNEKVGNWLVSFVRLSRLFRR